MPLPQQIPVRYTEEDAGYVSVRPVVKQVFRLHELADMVVSIASYFKTSKHSSNRLLVAILSRPCDGPARVPGIGCDRAGAKDYAAFLGFFSLELP